MMPLMLRHATPYFDFMPRCCLRRATRACLLIYKAAATSYADAAYAAADTLLRFYARLRWHAADDAAAYAAKRVLLSPAARCC